MVLKCALIDLDVLLAKHKENQHPSLKPFKCQVCGSSYFGAVFNEGKHVGRYCKGWSSGHDRSYIPCKGKHVELFDSTSATELH